MDDVLILLRTEKWQDNKLAWHETYKRRQVFCRKKSVTRNEFFEAGRNGLNPEFQFSIFAADYEGETICEYQGKTYSIYRTYRTPADYIELYVERKGGTNGKSPESHC